MPFASVADWGVVADNSRFDRLYCDASSLEVKRSPLSDGSVNGQPLRGTCSFRKTPAVPAAVNCAAETANISTRRLKRPKAPTTTTPASSSWRKRPHVFATQNATIKLWSRPTRLGSKPCDTPCLFRKHRTGPAPPLHRSSSERGKFNQNQDFSDLSWRPTTQSWLIPAYQVYDLSSWASVP